MDKTKFVAKTLHGLEKVLATELENIGATQVQPSKRAVTFEGDKTTLYRANYELRTALRILVPVEDFYARDEKQFYARVRDRVDWSEFMGADDTLAVDAVVQSQTFRHSKYLALTVKDAIVDQFRDKFGRRPDVNLGNPELRIHLHVHENYCQLLLDASGDSLHKRGYRREQTDAPINEVLAAGMLQLAGYDGSQIFIDPMCGSGTLAIEAAMIARRMPAKFLTPHFGFFRWRDFDKKLWENVKTEADSKLQPIQNQIFASDLDVQANNATAVNLMAAGLDREVNLQRKNFEKLEPPTETGGILMTNPPYDERLKVEEIENFYRKIGERFKHNWQGWTAWVISSNRPALNALHLRPTARHTLFNGKLECAFFKFQMYEGSKKGGSNVLSEATET